MADTPASSTDRPDNSAGLKDTFESILIALILAFVFRCFVVEAFVIPTGSMATTLLGANMRFQCEDCGYDFKTNYMDIASGGGGDEVVIPSQAVVVGRNGKPIMNGPGGKAIPYTFSLICPNCGFRAPKMNSANPANDATAPPVHYGDRILVLKYAYLGTDPSRWDVVVFKAPSDQRTQPINKPDFQQNYIKRLVGLPGEQLMLLDGDVYVRHTDVEPWTVQTKPRHVQQALWRVISDLDYQPRGLPRSPLADYESPWTASPASPSATFTEADHKRALVFVGKGSSAKLTFNPNANTNSRRFPFTDWLVFDSTAGQQGNQRAGQYDTYDYIERTPENSVSDLQLRLTYSRESGDGPLELNLTKHGTRFTAQLLGDAVRLFRTTPDGSETMLSTAPLPASMRNRPIRIEFENVDYRVALRIEGTEILASTPGQYAPDVDALLEAAARRESQPFPAVSIRAADQTCKVSHVSLWRDIFYVSNLPSNGSQSLRWAIPGSPIKLGPKEFFTLGDNSQLSLDGRFWPDPVDLRANEDLYAEPGRVPERFLLGKAFFVYWPAGHRPGENWPGVIPNFGEMRLIR